MLRAVLYVVSQGHWYPDFFRKSTFRRFAGLIFSILFVITILQMIGMLGKEEANPITSVAPSYTVRSISEKSMRNEGMLQDREQGHPAPSMIQPSEFRRETEPINLDPQEPIQEKRPDTTIRFDVPSQIESKSDVNQRLGLGNEKPVQGNIVFSEVPE